MERLSFPTWALTLLLGIIVTLIAFFKTNHTKRLSASHKVSAEETAFAQFLEEWQEENEALLRTLTDMQNDVTHRLENVQQRVSALESIIHTENGDRPRAPTTRCKDEDRGASLQERYADVFELAENGLTVTDIARKTGRGTGEVRLILGLATRGRGHE